MKLDIENDRAVLISLISNATISGSTVMIVADLVRRIQEAGLELDDPAPAEEVAE